MKLLIVSGLSGSGKTIALNTLEDAGYYCLDNIPTSLLVQVSVHLFELGDHYERVAIGLDIRSGATKLSNIESLINAIAQHDIDVSLVFLTADDDALVKRYGHTRRVHPLANQNRSLLSAIELEKELLSQVLDAATLSIDTTHLNVHQLTELLRKRLLTNAEDQVSIVVQSFGFKYGVPLDSDFIFDVRCLPNPYWEKDLRASCGKDQVVIDYLQSFDSVRDMHNDILTYLNKWIQPIIDSNRRYLTVGIGCTGGWHRSVYLSELLATSLGDNFTNASINVRHRELP